MMNWWCEKGIDGFRMDVISMISKEPGLPDGTVFPGGKYGFPNVVNGPHVHEYLQEMNREVLSRYDLMTVGECSGVTIEEAKKYARSDGRELSMVFQFEHVGLDDGKYGKWTDRRVDLRDFKKVMSKWQTQLSGKAWNSLFLGNHDQPRSLSRFGCDAPLHRERCAKMLATCLHMMQGTPYIYQGEELGMTNCPFDSLDEVRDIESLNAFQELTEAGAVTPEDMLRYINLRGRDTARSPMQWDESENAGFTTGEPWIKVNPNYKQINAAAELADENSVFHYYKKLIALRRQEAVMVYGDYELLEPESESLYVYTRTLGQEKLLVICNFTDRKERFILPKEFRDGRILIGNGERERVEAELSLLAYEALVIKK